MSEAKHTPGPWELDSAKDGRGNRDADIFYVFHGNSPHADDYGYPVADTMNRHHCISPEEDAANARLIAAAPELLEALEKIDERIHRLRDFG